MPHKLTNPQDHVLGLMKDGYSLILESDFKTQYRPEKIMRAWLVSKYLYEENEPVQMNTINCLLKKGLIRRIKNGCVVTEKGWSVF